MAIAASLAWGLADYLAAVKSRRLPIVTVVIVSQGVQVLVVLGLVAVSGPPPPMDAFPAFAAGLAGVTGSIGILAFYRGLALGAIGLVAPITATAVVVPVILGVVQGERPTLFEGAGVALAFAGILLISWQQRIGKQGLRAVRRSAGFALLAAFATGWTLVSLDAAADGGLLWTVLIFRFVSLALVSGAAVIFRPPTLRPHGELRGLAALGVLEILASMFFVAAVSRGLLSLVSVLASLYPVVAMVLARIFLSERLARPQQAGAACALAGVVLIAAG